MHVPNAQGANWQDSGARTGAMRCAVCARSAAPAARARLSPPPTTPCCRPPLAACCLVL